MSLLLERSLLGEIKEAGENECLLKMVTCYISLEEENPVLGDQDVLLGKNLNEKRLGNKVRASHTGPQRSGQAVWVLSYRPEASALRWASASYSCKTFTRAAKSWFDKASLTPPSQSDTSQRSKITIPH